METTDAHVLTADLIPEVTHLYIDDREATGEYVEPWTVKLTSKRSTFARLAIKFVNGICLAAVGEGGNPGVRVVATMKDGTSRDATDAFLADGWRQWREFGEDCGHLEPLGRTPIESAQERVDVLKERDADAAAARARAREAVQASTVATDSIREAVREGRATDAQLRLARKHQAAATRRLSRAEGWLAETESALRAAETALSDLLAAREQDAPASEPALPVALKASAPRVDTFAVPMPFASAPAAALSPSQELEAELRRLGLLPSALLPVVRAQGTYLVLGRGDDEELCTLSRDAEGRYVASDANFDTIAKGVRPSFAFGKLIAHVVDEHLPTWDEVTPAEAAADLAVRGHRQVEVRADGSLAVTAAGRQLEACLGPRRGSWILSEGGRSLHPDRDGADWPYVAYRIGLVASGRDGQPRKPVAPFHAALALYEAHMAARRAKEEPVSTKLSPEQEEAVDAAVARLEALCRDEAADLFSHPATHAEQIVAAQLLAPDTRDDAERARAWLDVREAASSHAPEVLGQAAEVATWLADVLSFDRGAGADEQVAVLRGLAARLGALAAPAPAPVPVPAASEAAPPAAAAAPRGAKVAEIRRRNALRMALLPVHAALGKLGLSPDLVEDQEGRVRVGLGRHLSQADRGGGRPRERLGGHRRG
jgi:hypothetical protein